MRLADTCGTGSSPAARMAAIASSVRLRGRPGSEGNRYAVSVGLKKRDSADCIKDYVKDILPAVREAGLKLPPKDRLAVDLPDDIEWPLD